MGGGLFAGAALTTLSHIQLRLRGRSIAGGCRLDLNTEARPVCSAGLTVYFEVLSPVCESVQGLTFRKTLTLRLPPSP